MNYSKVVSVLFNYNKNLLTIYSNPSKDKITISGNHIASICIVDNISKIIKQHKLNNASNPSISVHELPAGVYYIRSLTTDGEESINKVIKK